MSRVGKAPIEFPKEVSIETQENQVVVKGPKGELVHLLPKGVQVEMEDNQLLVSSYLVKELTKKILIHLTLKCGN